LAALCQRIRSSFGIADARRLTLKYRDEDDDWITVATEVELTEAMSHCGSPLKLFLFVEPTSNDRPSAQIQTQNLPAHVEATTKAATATTTCQLNHRPLVENEIQIDAPTDEILEKLGKQKKVLSKKEKKMLKMKLKKEKKELKKAKKNQKYQSPPEKPQTSNDVCLLVSSELSLDEKKKAAALMKEIEVLKMKKKMEVKALKDEILQKKLDLSLLKDEKKREIQIAKQQLQTLLQEAKSREIEAKKKEQAPLFVPLTTLTPTAKVIPNTEAQGTVKFAENVSEPQFAQVKKTGKRTNRRKRRRRSSNTRKATG